MDSSLSSKGLSHSLVFLILGLGDESFLSPFVLYLMVVPAAPAGLPNLLASSGDFLSLLFGSRSVGIRELPFLESFASPVLLLREIFLPLISFILLGS